MPTHQPQQKLKRKQSAPRTVSASGNSSLSSTSLRIYRPFHYEISAVFPSAVELARTTARSTGGLPLDPNSELADPDPDPTPQQVAEAINRTHPTWIQLSERDIFECAIRLKNESDYRTKQHQTSTPGADRVGMSVEKCDDGSVEEFIHYPDRSYTIMTARGGILDRARRRSHPSCPIVSPESERLQIIWTSLEPTLGSLSPELKRHVRSILTALAITFLFYLHTLAFSGPSSTSLTIYSLSIFINFKYIEPLNLVWGEVRFHIIRRRIGWWILVLLWASVLMFLFGFGRAGRWFAWPVALWFWSELLAFESDSDDTKTTTASSKSTTTKTSASQHLHSHSRASVKLFRRRVAFLSLPIMIFLSWTVHIHRRSLVAAGLVMRLLLGNENDYDEGGSSGSSGGDTIDVNAQRSEDRTDIVSLLTISFGWTRWGMDLEWCSTFLLYFLWIAIGTLKRSLSRSFRNN